MPPIDDNQTFSNTVKETSVPADSLMTKRVVQADFSDAYEVQVANGERSPLAWYLDFASRTPAWVDSLMTLRNRAGGLMGLKDVGNLADVPPPTEAGNLKVGDRAGIFTIAELTDREVVLAIEDKHLDVAVSVYRSNERDKNDQPIAKIKVITAVKNHNLLGRLYMLPVAPMHKRIVQAMLAQGGAPAHR